jgi:hypothetical protein
MFLIPQKYAFLLPWSLYHVYPPSTRPARQVLKVKQMTDFIKTLQFLQIELPTQSAE